MRYFENRTMGFKLTAVFLFVIFLPMLFLAYFSYLTLDKNLHHEAKEELEMGVKSSWTEYYARGEQMRLGMLQASMMEEIKSAVARREGAYLKKQISSWKQMRPYVDIWTVVDSDGRVIARVNSENKGDFHNLGDLVERALATGEAAMSTEILPAQALRYEGGLIKDIAPGPETTAAEKMGAEALALMVVVPVKSGEKTVGAIITADVLNNDPHIPEALTMKNRDIFASISMRGMRISTNLVDGHGRSLNHTMIPAHFLNTLKEGKPVEGEWEVAGMNFISRAEPIRDFRGNVIGALGVSISRDHLWAVQSENQRIIALATIIGITIAILAAVVSTFRITRPIRQLKDRMSAFASGDLKARVAVEENGSSRDEMTILSQAFNSMADEVVRRDEENKNYLLEIEKKNEEFMALNDELRKTNEELEVAYEETQSQTEELHAINEELKLLNEDLDRKNSELLRANDLIRREEQELKAAKDKLRLIFDSIGEHVLLVDKECRIIEANRSFTRSLGLNENVVAGKEVYGFFGMRAPVRDCPVRKSIENLSPLEKEFTTDEGRILQWNSFPFIEYGEPNKAVLYIRDITEQRYMTQKLIQTDKLSSLGELVSGVAHELNNPLTGIMCFSELLLDTGLPDPVKSKIKKINDATHRCKRIIDNLLTFARWKRSEKKCEDLNKLIRESVELRAYQLRIDNIDVELDLDSSIPETMLDDNQIQQVFLNLINNARDAIKEKGGMDGKIRISTSLKDGKILARVDDTGAGFPEEIAKRIFDPFFTTKGVGKGTGLGLSISYGIIHEHGGNIQATSTPGAGTSFYIELPVLARSSVAEAHDHTADYEPLRLSEAVKGMRALVLDDEVIIAELLRETLNNLGFAVEAAPSAREALERIRKNDYDLVVSDIKMPGMDGKDFYREIKEARPDTLGKVIFITGDSVNKETHDFLRKTGNLYLKKPFTIDQLASAVSRLVMGPEKSN